MWKKIALGALSLWIITIGIAGYFFVKGTGKTGDDGRLAVALKR